MKLFKHVQINHVAYLEENNTEKCSYDHHKNALIGALHHHKQDNWLKVAELYSYIRIIAKRTYHCHDFKQNLYNIACKEDANAKTMQKSCNNITKNVQIITNNKKKNLICNTETTRLIIRLMMIKIGCFLKF